MPLSTRSALVVAVAGILATYILSLLAFRRRSRGLPYPPGPTPSRVFENLFDLPINHSWLTYDKWHRAYGDVVHIKVFGTSLIIVGSMKAASEFFDKRAKIYSDRPRAPMIHELMGLGEWSVANMNYGNVWRKHRRTFTNYFRENTVSKYHPVLVKETHAMLKRFLKTPEDFLGIVRLAFAAEIMDVTYGLPVNDLDNEYVTIAETAASLVSQAAVPGAFVVDLFPILKHVPSWFPGAGFKRKAKVWRALNDVMRTKPFIAAKTAWENGSGSPCVAASMLDELPDGEQRGVEEEVAMNASAVAYAGGTDTTVSAVTSFIMAMAMDPSIQAKAREELDRIVGTSRLPDYNDRAFLPYINAICKESMRWQPVTPLGGARAACQDDVWNGYFIPKDAIVIGNVWSILRDPVAYPEPDQFKPERFLKDGQLDPQVRDPSTAAFGFGRRICPGRYFSDASLYIVVASVLTAFTIEPPVDGNGKPLKMSPDMTGGAISHPVPFKCIIKPRSEQMAELIRDIYIEI
ncbi:cytochrome P450 [Mycena maculata]|uniref:Cytochrome P450 n=1 Tax=Mycena maculata TaxID=230809 RepID=A0AAD7ITU7_9AGAR|nr:cytochrome P450 [Mycena maculata]